MDMNRLQREPVRNDQRAEGGGLRQGAGRGPLRHRQGEPYPGVGGGHQGHAGRGRAADRGAA